MTFQWPPHGGDRGTEHHPEFLNGLRTAAKEAGRVLAADNPGK